MGTALNIPSTSLHFADDRWGHFYSNYNAPLKRDLSGDCRAALFLWVMIDEHQNQNDKSLEVQYAEDPGLPCCQRLKWIIFSDRIYWALNCSDPSASLACLTRTNYLNYSRLIRACILSHFIRILFHVNADFLEKKCNWPRLSFNQPKWKVYQLGCNHQRHRNRNLWDFLSNISFPGWVTHVEE